MNLDNPNNQKEEANRKGQTPEGEEQKGQTPEEGEQGTQSNQSEDKKDGGKKDGDGKKQTEGGALRKQLEDTLAELKKYKEKERKEEEEEARKNGEYEKLLQQKDERIKELENQIKDKEVSSKLEKAVKKYGVRSDLVDLAMDRVKKEVKTDEEGNVTNLENVMEEMKNNHGSLFEDQSQKLNNHVPTSNNSSGSRLSMKQYKSLSTSERREVKKQNRQPIGM